MNDAPLPPEVRALLDATRDDYAENADVRARVHWKLQARLADERAGGLGRRRAQRWKWTAAFLFGSAVAAAAIWGDRLVVPGDARSNDLTPAIGPRTTSPPREIEPTNDALDNERDEPDEGNATTPSETEVVEAPKGVTMGTRRSSSAGSTTPSEKSEVAPQSEGAQSLREELEALRAANALRQSGDPNGALALLNEFERTHPKGVLVQERSAARIFALCAAGRADEARARAERFAALFPKSPHLPRVQRGCGNP